MKGKIVGRQSALFFCAYLRLLAKYAKKKINDILKKKKIKVRKASQWNE